MAKKQKIRLKMTDGYDVKDLSELQSHADMSSILHYYHTGELRQWLQERYYDDEAEKLDALHEGDVDFAQKLCKVIGMPYRPVQLESSLPSEKLDDTHIQTNELTSHTTLQNHNQDTQSQESPAIHVGSEVSKIDDTETTQKNPSHVKEQEVAPQKTFVPDSSPSRTSILDFFSTKKRLNRKKYMLRFLTLCAFFIAITIVFAIIDTIMLQIPAFMPLAMLAASIIVWISFLMATICRLHDLGHSGWWCVIFFVPYVNIAFAIYLILFKGTNGSNKYGDDPLAMNTESN